jgi:hypothetical protein
MGKRRACVSETYLVLELTMPTRLLAKQGISMTNHAPVVTVKNVTVAANQTVNANSLIASATDQDGDAITQYVFWDGGSGGGHFELSGVTQAFGQAILVSAADLASAQVEELGRIVDDLRTRSLAQAHKQR